MPNHNYSLVPNFRGTQLLKDNVTGLLYSNNTSGFTLTKKRKFIEIAPKYFPDITVICELIGISKNAYKCHYMVDPVFAQCMDALEEKTTDQIEAAMAKFALQQGNFMDRIAWLRAHRGEKYNEKKIIQVQPLSSAKVEEKKLNLQEAVDAELVGEPPAPQQIEQSASLPNQ